ncbi:tRNA lysidine(34) synthetase TilS [Pedobacter sp.]|jgi:tRNA(Ile)-lysidine synthase|uniref:tRNA lysidine(34) synthetase TilS n=1 Tax=Pedobacter sp. TaxID=1411316 RepID=UPI002C699F45|nr:tRNA lysidine(34) synthetase TilS [Pedobacter sp.]HWW43260.1 tRNA lysidine(34) synthetase TilS [Pedobacter sp.]
MFPLQKFQDYIVQNSLLSGNEKVLLTVSGGKDSVLMAHLFKLSGCDFGIAHCNFNLRGQESQRDEAFVRMLASQLEVPFYVVHFETKAYAEEHKISTQMAARELRYTWFEKLRVQEDYQLIAVAHHQNDAVETVLLNLTRGTGIAGLHGILPRRGFLIRPMLCLSSEEIEEAIVLNHLSYVEDSSNASDKYARNKIRQKVIPQLKAINPNLEETFEHNIRRFAEAEMVLQQRVLQVQKEICKTEGAAVLVDLESIGNLVPQRLLFFEILKTYHFTEKVTDDILQSLDHQSGRSFYSISHRATLDRGKLMITEHTGAMVQEAVLIHPHDQKAVMANQVIEITYTDNINFEKEKFKAFADAGKLIYPLILRKWEYGDRFMPLGMKTLKKISDFFIDEKVPLPLKDQVPVLVNGNGELIWIAGMRQDNRYKLTTATKKVAIFELKIS